MNVAIVGCGLIGKKRAQVFSEFREDKLLVVCDVDEQRARSLAATARSDFRSDWKDVVGRQDIDCVIVSTSNDKLAEVSRASLEAGKHVLCEKPLGRNVEEATDINAAAKHTKAVLKTGFNHRFHPALSKAKELFDAGVVGRALTIRARYGHGGRPGMEAEWRSKKNISGGGELLDQGVHVVDLIRWFAGDITEVMSKTETKFWNIAVEDNAFAIVKTVRGVTGMFHVSWTNWRNVFSFELFGERGYLLVSGLGGSYGTESLEVGIRNPKGGRPETKQIEFEENDGSWLAEWQEFHNAIVQSRLPLGSGEDGLKANIVLEAIYESSRSGETVVLS